MNQESKALPDDIVRWVHDVLLPERGMDGGNEGPAISRHRRIPPGGARPRWLIPSEPRRAAQRAASAYWRLRNAPHGWAFMALGVGIGLLGTRLLPNEQRAHGQPGATLDDPRTSLLAHLGDVLETPGVLTSIDLPWAHHRTPKLRMLLLRPSGDVVGYAKVGWNEHTRQMIAHEASVLSGLAHSESTVISAPRVLYEGTWRGRSILVTEPLPARTRRLRRRDPDPLELARQVPLLELAGRSTVCESPYWRRMIADLHDLARTASPRASAMIDAALRLSETVSERYGEIELEWGRWHGDWIDRNMGLADGRLWVWDWERSDAGVPVGFDVLQREVKNSNTSSGLELGAQRLRTWIVAPNPCRDAITMATVGLHRLDLLRSEAIWTDRTLPSRRFEVDVVATLPDLMR